MLRFTRVKTAVAQIRAAAFRFFWGEHQYATGRNQNLENTRNSDNIGAKELLVVSFGTSYASTREKTICAIEEDMEKVCPDYSVRRGFTSGRIKKILAERDGIHVDSEEEAIARAAANGVKTLVIQPTHLWLSFSKNSFAAVTGVVQR